MNALRPDKIKTFCLATKLVWGKLAGWGCHRPDLWTGNMREKKQQQRRTTSFGAYVDGGGMLWGDGPNAKGIRLWDTRRCLRLFKNV